MNQLLPPLQIWLVELLAIALLLFFANSNLRIRTKNQILSFSLIVSLLLTAVVTFFLGIGAVWSFPSALGKILSAFVSLAIPVFITAITFLTCQRFKLKTAISNTISIIAGLIAVLPIVVIGIMLACVTTKDCL